MKRKNIVLFLLMSMLAISNIIPTNAAVSRVIRGKRISGLAELARIPEKKFTCQKATRTGNTFKNTWSNYYITCNNSRSGYDYYDVNDKDSQYDLALVFNDESRLAIYYTTLSRDINTVAMNFANSTGIGKGMIEDKLFCGTVFKHIAVPEPEPYGTTNYHEYYIRAIDSDKLMVVDIYYTNLTDQALQSFLTMAPIAVK